MTEKKFRQSQLFEQDGETNAWLEKPELDKEAKTSNLRKAEWEAKKESRGKKSYPTKFGRSGRFVRRTRWDPPRTSYSRSAYDGNGRQEAVREIPRNLQYAPAPAKDPQQCYRCHQFGEAYSLNVGLL